MNNLRYQFRLIRRHRQYGGWRQAIGFALYHWRWWHWGAPPSDEGYTHIGSDRKKEGGAA